LAEAEAHLSEAFGRERGPHHFLGPGTRLSGLGGILEQQV